MTEEVIDNAAAPAAAPAPSADPAASPAAAPSAAPTQAPAPEPAPAPPASKWSDTWREDMAGKLADDASDDQKAEHTKLLARLKRLNSPADVAKAVREQDKLISSGQLKRALPKDAKPEDIAKWRAENGIPETADKYDLGISKDTPLTDLDKKTLLGFVEKFHGANASPDVVRAFASTYIEMRDAAAQEMEQANEAAKSEAIEMLRAEWGVDYKPNMDGINSMLNHMGSAVADEIASARDDNHIQLLNKPEVIKQLAAHARELGYVGATVVPSGGDVGATIEQELAELKKQMGTPEWEKNSKGQARFIQLTEAKHRMDARK